jgi:hypothetical protein
MFRKAAFALAAVATLGAAALVPTTASAKHFGFGFRGFGLTVVTPGYYGVYNGCWRYRWIETRSGLIVRKLVNVCY